MKKLLVAALLLCGSAAYAQDRARFVGHVVASDANPCVRVHIDPALSFIGRVEGGVMDGAGRAERFVFGDVANGRLRRAAIVHFEHFLPDNNRTFNYPRFRMDTLAAHEYLHQVWPQPKMEMFASAPLDSLFKAQGISTGESWLMNRWARVVSDDKKHELLLFYVESEEVLQASVAALREQWQPQGIAKAPHYELEAEFIRRARTALRVEGCPTP